MDLAVKPMWALNLKGCIQEFGHAPGHPHLSPKPLTQLGNTLMGLINRAFKAKAKLDYEEPQVYLSEASAAMLVYHPIFQKNR